MILCILNMLYDWDDDVDEEDLFFLYFLFIFFSPV